MLEVVSEAAMVFEAAGAPSAKLALGNKVRRGANCIVSFERGCVRVKNLDNEWSELLSLFIKLLVVRQPKLDAHEV